LHPHRDHSRYRRRMPARQPAAEPANRSNTLSTLRFTTPKPFHSVIATMGHSKTANDELLIPCTPGEFTPRCLTALLRRSGTLQHSNVVAVELAPLAAGLGYVGQSALLKLTYDNPEPNAPERVFAKLSSADPETRAKFKSVGLYETEEGFYRELSSDAGIRVPRAYATHYNPATGECLLLLEDIRHMRFGDNLAGSTLAEAKLILASLARMHSRFWNNQRLTDCSWLRADNTDPAAGLQFYRAMVPLFETRCEADLTPELTFAARTFGHCMEDWLSQLAAGEFTLTHGDFRPDNFAFDETGAMVVFDWQTARRSANSRDVAYFMALALPVDIRRKHESELLELYHQALLANGIRNYTMPQLCTDYRRSLGSALIVLVIAGAILDFSSDRGAQLRTALCDRVGAAVTDHDYAAWLPSHLGMSRPA
jgi:hypothetical protein